ncbi:MAG: hypothetical protein IJ875_07390 [Solobacterium sp.]|nr:hypothetical protein [Solobacterium sp.]
MTQYQHDPNEKRQSDLWEDYLNEEEKYEGPKLSDQVQKDIINFKYENSVRPMKQRNLPKIGIILGIIFLLLTTFVVISGRSGAVSYNEQPHYEEVIINDPLYEVEEVEYDEISDDLRIPEFMVNEKVYRLPVSVSELISNEFELRGDSFTTTSNEVGEEPVTMLLVEDGYIVANALVVSPTGETVPIEDAMVVGIASVPNGYFAIPDYLSTYSSETYLLDYFEYANISYEVERVSNNEKYYYVHNVDDNETEYKNYTLRLRVVDGEIETIVMELKK